MVSSSLKITGIDELQKALRALPEKIAARAVVNALRAGARVVRDEAKRLVPEGKTGELKRGIKVRTVRKANRRAEGAIITVTVEGPAAWRAHLTEFGSAGGVVKSGAFAGAVIPPRPAQPFLRPAARNKAGAATAKIKAALAKSIEKEAAKALNETGASRKR